MAINHAAPIDGGLATLCNRNTFKMASAVWGLGRPIRLGLVLLAVLFVLAALPTQAQSGPAPTQAAAQFSYAKSTVGSGLVYLQGVAVDGAGNVYVADAGTPAIDKYSPNGSGGYTKGTVAPGFNALVGIAVDAGGNVYVVDHGTGNNDSAVYKYIPNGSGGYTKGTVASGIGNDLSAVAVDGQGNVVYFADRAAHTVYAVSYNSGSGAYSAPIQVDSNFMAPVSVAVDASGNVYVADQGDGKVYKEIFNGNTGTYTQTTVDSNFTAPVGVAVDASGNVYVTDQSAEKVYKEIFGSSTGSYTRTTVDSNFIGPVRVAVDATGNVYAADQGAGAVYLLQTAGVNFFQTLVNTSTPSTQTLTFSITSGGVIGAPKVLTMGAPNLDFTDAGTGSCTNGAGFGPNGTCTVVVKFKPQYAGLRMGAVNLVDSDGAVLATAYIYGTGTGPQVSFLPASQSTIFNAVNAGLIIPQATAVDGAGNIYIADIGTNRVLKETLSAGSYTQSEIPVTNLMYPRGVAVDGAGNIYVVDTTQALKLAPSGSGNYTQSTMPGLGPTVQGPNGIAVDGAGNVYITDTDNNRVLKETPSADGYTWSTIGSGLSGPVGVAVDGVGNVYIVDVGRGRVLKETLSGDSYTQNTLMDHNYGLNGIAVDGTGNVYIADATSNVVWKETPSGSSYTESLISASLEAGSSIAGVAVDVAGNVYMVDWGNSQIIKLDFADPPTLNLPATSGAAQDVTVVNIGNAQLDISQIAAFGNLNTQGPDTSCNSNGQQLDAGTSCILDIEFTPQSGTNSGSVVLTDNDRNAAAPAYATQTINLGPPGPVTITLLPTMLSDATVGVPYSQTFTASGGIAPFTYSASSIPSGLTLSSAGVLSGTPATTGNFNITVTATDQNSNSGSQIYPLAITPTLPSLVASAGTPQSTSSINGVFAVPLTVTVQDGYGYPVSGATVTFTAPALGASATLSATSATTDANGQASVTATANGTAGSYEVTATLGAMKAYFSLSNGPANLVVTTTADNDGGIAASCTIQAAPNVGTDPSCSLRDALLEAAELGAGVITFDSTKLGSAPTIPMGSWGFMNVPSNTSITGPTTGSGSTLTNLVTISWDGSHAYGSTVYVDTGVTGVAIANLNFTNGGTPSCGAVCNFGTLTLTNATFSNNAGGAGGAIRNGGTLTVSNSTFSGNSGTQDGGAIYNGAGTLTVNNSTFSSNSVTEANATGGAIFNMAAAEVNNSTFSGNCASFQYGGVGGGISNAFGTLTVNNSTFSGNCATGSDSWGGKGGGIFQWSGTLNVINSTFSGNYVDVPGSGGGIFIADGTLLLANSIVSGNWHGTSSSVSGYDDLGDNSGSTTFALAQGNSGGNEAGYYNVWTGPPPVVPPSPAANLSPLGNYGGATQTMLPLPGSPAICAGTANPQSGLSLPTTDQRGGPRTNTSYPGYSASTPCVDAGAVQTNYSLAFTTQPSPIAPESEIKSGKNFQAAVSVSESGALVTPPVTIPLVMTSGSGTLTGGSVQTVNGVADYTLSVSQGGTSDTLTANLTLNSSFTPSLVLLATSAPFDVVQMPLTAASLSSSASSIVVGNSVTLTATITALAGGTPTGTVNFVDGGSNLGSANLDGRGVAGLTVNTLALGSHSITAVYGGDTNFAGSTSPAVNVTVNSAVTATQAVPSIALTQNRATSSFKPVTGAGGVAPLTYSILPSLPTGLSFNNSTGAITGTPTATSGATTYTVTVTDANGATASNTFSLTVNAAVTATQAVASKGLTRNRAANFTPVTGSGGTGTLTYSISPSLPTGLSFSKPTGAITGTPTATSSLTTYTVTVTDANGATASNTFSLTVNPTVTANQVVASKALTQNLAATSFTPVTGTNGTTPLSYTVSPSLPAGLGMSSTTGAITGTPTAASSTRSYTVTVTDANGATATNTFSLTVNAAVTATQAVASKTLTQNRSTTSFTPVTGGGGTGTLTFSISPSLPSGLSFNTSTGTVTGTPTGTHAVSTFTVTVTDANGATASNTFSLTVNSAVTATQATPSIALTQNHAANFTPVTGSGGTTPLNYSVSPTLPTGLNINSSTGAITGTPTATSGATGYTVTLTDANGATASNTFSLTVNSALTATQATPSIALTQNHTANFTPVTGSGGTTPLNYSVSPTLPTGLNINSSTGAITGTPTVTSGTTTYTVTVTDANGATASNTFSLTVNAAVTANQAVASKALTQNYATTSFMPITGGGGTGILTFSISPSLPTGLSFNTSTGAITGTPTVPCITTTYMVTVTDANGATASNTFSLTVNSALTVTQIPAEPVMSYNQPVSQFVPVTASGGTAPLHYSVSPALPAGLNFDTSTGAISGTPTATSPVTPYTVTVTDANNATANSTISLSVGKATASVTLSNLSQTYTGSPLAAGITVVPAVSYGVTYTGIAPTVYSPNSTPSTEPGSYTVAVVVADNNYTGGATGTLVINQLNPALSLAPQNGAPAQPSYGTNLQFELSMASTPVCPTGTVNFYVDGGDQPAYTTTLNGTGCTAPTENIEFQTASLAAGPHFITAVYSGDTYYQGGTSNQLAQTIYADGTAVTLATSAQTVNVGDAVTFTATVTPSTVNGGFAQAPTGSVTFNQVDGQGNLIATLSPAVALSATSPYTASFSTSSLPAGAYSIQAVFTDTDGNFQGSSSVVAMETVELRVPAITWTPNVATVTYGNPLGSDQLNATATDTETHAAVPGTFVYVPAAGSVQGVGNPNLQVTFKPADAATYATQTATATITVTPATLTVTGITVSNKRYDGTTTATIDTTSAALSGVMSGDTGKVMLVTANAVGAFSDANVGTAKTVTISGLTLSGSAAGNYRLTAPSGLTAEVTPATLTVSGIAISNKIYDGNTAATVTGTAALSGLIAPDTATLGGTPTATFASANVGAGIAVTVSGYSISGGQSANYALSQPGGLTASITPATLTVTGITINNKTYDGTTTATINATSAALSGALSGDTGKVTLVTANATGAFSDENVGTAKTVTISGLTLSGSAASNYTLTQPTTMANITAKTLTVTGVSASNKTYDGTTTATITGTAALSGLIGSDTATVGGTPTATFASANVSTNIPVTVSGYSISGGQSANYALTQPSGVTASITPATLTVTGITVSNKTYNGNAAATINITGATLSGVLSGDTGKVTLVTTSAAGVFSHASVGTATTVTISGLTLSGPAAGNYTLTAPSGLTADITPATLTVTGITASNKIYDGKTSATLNTATAALSGVVSADAANVTLLTSGAVGVFNSASAGNGIIVTISGLTLSGSAASNYTLTQPTTMANITAKTLTVTGVSASNKTYDGTTTATITGTAALSGLIAPDTATLGGTPTAMFASANVGTNIPVTASGYAISGGQSGNYTLTQPSGLTASITPATLTVTADNQSRGYGVDNPALTFQYGGFINGESQSVVTTAPVCSTTAAASSPVGAYDITCSGGAAANYAVSYVKGKLTIAPATLTVAANNAAITYGSLLPSLTGTLTGVVNNDNITTSYTTTAISSSAAGTYPITPVLSDPNGRLGNYAVASTNGTLTINKAGSLAALQTSAANVLLKNGVTFTVQVTSSTTGTPTGGVTFMDGGTSLGDVSLTNGSARLTLSALAAGTHTITASYAGDGNFAGITSAAVTETVQDFQLVVKGSAGGTALSATVLPGGAAVYHFLVAPLGGPTFPSAVTLALSGLPAGATYTITPSTIPAGAGTTDVTVTVQTTKTVAGLHRSGRGMAGMFLGFGLVFPLFGLVRLRQGMQKRARRTTLLFLLLALAITGMSACGSGSGFFSQTQQTYTLTVTGTSGALQHSGALNLTIQ